MKCIILEKNYQEVVKILELFFFNKEVTDKIVFHNMINDIKNLKNIEDEKFKISFNFGVSKVLNASAVHVT